jgi:hypothetical protein
VPYDWTAIRARRVAHQRLRRFDVDRLSDAEVLRLLNAAGADAPRPLDVLCALLERAVPVDDRQWMTELDDGSRVIFRRDFGEHAHGLPDHYNIEVQARQRRRHRVVHDLHLEVDAQGRFDRAWASGAD